MTRKGRAAGGRGRAPRPSWTERALTDLEAIGDHIAEDDPRAATRWLRELMAAADRAARVPRLGRVVPELAREDVREVLKGSYRIVYRVREGRIDVLTVFEGHRRLPGYVKAED